MKKDNQEVNERFDSNDKWFNLMEQRLKSMKAKLDHLEEMKIKDLETKNQNVHKVTNA